MGITNNKRIDKPLVLMVIFFVIFSIFLGLKAFNQALAFTSQVNYQGKLTDTSGNPLSGNYNLRFRICEDTNCASIEWEEERVSSTAKTTITNGLFSVMLGEYESLSGFDFNRTLYFEVAVGGTGDTPSWDVLLPRRVIGSVPSAFNSEKIDGLTTSSLAVLDRYNEFTQENLFVATTTFSGNVGIGTTTPTYKLTVDGDIGISAGSAYKYDGVDLAYGSTTLKNYFFGDSGNLGMTGGENTSVGYHALLMNVGGYYNTAIGAHALSQNVGTTNTAIGHSALSNNTNGSSNMALGNQSLHSNISGNDNVAVGYSSGFNASGSRNIFLGSNADLLLSASTSQNAIAIGYNAKVGGSNMMALGGTEGDAVSVGIGTTTPIEVLDVYGNIQINAGSAYKYDGVDLAYGSTTLGNYFFGGAGNLNMTGIGNSAFGLDALTNNTTGEYNAAFGAGALSSNNTGQGNLAFGSSALGSNNSGRFNSAVGFQALLANTTGIYNTAVGFDSLSSNIAGDYNTVLGSSALSEASSSLLNTAIGYSAGTGNGDPNHGSLEDAYMTLLGAYASRDSNFPSTTPIFKSVAIGYNAKVGGSNMMALGGVGTDAVSVGIGTSTPSYRLTVNSDNSADNLLQVATTTNQNIFTINNDGIARFGLGLDVTGDVNISGQYKISGQSIFHVDPNNYYAGYSAGNAENNLASSTKNVAIGSYALSSNLEVFNSVAIGYEALKNTTSSSYNVGIGWQALRANLIGNYNLAVGISALLSNTSGNANVALGASSLQSNISGERNMAIGINSLFFNQSGNYNVAIGPNALYYNQVGDANVAIGWRSLFNNLASNNSAFGTNALEANIDGTYNVAFGSHAGWNGSEEDRSMTDDRMVFIGANSSRDGSIVASTTKLTNSIAIGYNSKVGGSNMMALGGIGTDAVNVGINTSTPGYRLTVVGNSYFNGNVTTTGNLTVGSLNGLLYATNGLVGTTSLSVLGVTSSQWVTNGSDIYYSIGNVGIGTTSPSQKLVVAGTSSMQDILPQTNLTYNLGSSVLRWSNLWAETVNIGTSTWSINNGADGRLSFYNQAMGLGDERFTMLSNGNIGVGTSTPIEKLVVVGDLRVSGVGNKIIFPDGTVMTTAASSSLNVTSSPEDLNFAADNDSDGDGVINFAVKGDSALYINNDGWVGIGTTNPQGRFHIQDSGDNLNDPRFMIHATVSTSPSRFVFLSDPDYDTGLNNRLIVGKQGPGNLYAPRAGFISNIGTSSFYIYQNPDAVSTTPLTAVALAVDGVTRNVGIGTTTPQAKLHVVASSSDPTGIVLQRSNKETGFGIMNGNLGNFINFSGSGIEIATSTSSTLTAYQTAAKSILTIKDSGNIGIGTTTPVEKLVVNGNTVITGDGYATSFIETSDLLLKTNINNLNYGLNDILNLRPVSFDYLSTGRPSFGFIAQEVKEIIPEIVYGKAGGYGLNYSILTALLAKGIQEQQQQIDLLSSDLNSKLIVLENDADASSEDIVALPVTEANPQFDTLRVSGATDFYGTITVIGEAGFISKVTFEKDVEIKGKLYVSADQAGTTKIPAGETSIEVEFEGEYESIPKVVASVAGVKSIFYGIEDKATTGFRIVINEPFIEDLEFDWIALAVKKLEEEVVEEFEPAIGNDDSSGSSEAQPEEQQNEDEVITEEVIETEPSSESEVVPEESIEESVGDVIEEEAQPEDEPEVLPETPAETETETPVESSEE
jgi:trimeric autotransporter adhesin